MTGRLQGKKAFVTGSGTGIGRAAAELFAAEGAMVAVIDINAQMAADTAAAIEAAGGRSIAIQTDITDESSVKDAVSKVNESFGGIDVLYNCAGGSIVEDEPIDQVDMDKVFDHTIGLDLKGSMLCARHILPIMKANDGGAIVNMASVAALQGNFPAHIYSAAKGGIISFTRSLAGRYSRNNIRSNAICPGVVLSDRVKDRFGEQQGKKDSVQARSVGGSMTQRHPFSVGEPIDIARIALFLASDEARMINGAIIPAEGGLSAY
ncbi:MAG: SDR family oxidoreductase [Pseudomonadales bacterium]|nr:SDR family oxidoreductase [Pseudomonadales bacterium]